MNTLRIRRWHRLWKAAARAVRQTVPTDSTPIITPVERSSPSPNGPPVAAAEMAEQDLVAVG